MQVKLKTLADNSYQSVYCDDRNGTLVNLGTLKYSEKHRFLDSHKGTGTSKISKKVSKAMDRNAKILRPLLKTLIEEAISRDKISRSNFSPGMAKYLEFL